MTDWADATAAKLRQREDEQKLKDAKFVEQQRIKNAAGIPLWREVREQVKNNCESLNLNMRKAILAFEVVPNTELSVRADLGGSHRWIKARFDADQSELQWECGARKEKWYLMVNPDGRVVFAWGMGIPTTPGAIATQLLNTLLETEL